MRKSPSAYFGGRCSVAHTLNAKVIWASKPAIRNLLAAFDTCLELLVGQAQAEAGTCTCWDEETVLAHLHGRVPPCDTLNSTLLPPTFVHMDVYDKNKRIH